MRSKTRARHSPELRSSLMTPTTRRVAKLSRDRECPAHPATQVPRSPLPDGGKRIVAPAQPGWRNRRIQYLLLEMDGLLESACLSAGSGRQFHEGLKRRKRM